VRARARRRLHESTTAQDVSHCSDDQKRHASPFATRSVRFDLRVSLWRPARSLRYAIKLSSESVAGIQHANRDRPVHFQALRKKKDEEAHKPEPDVSKARKDHAHITAEGQVDEIKMSHDQRCYIQATIPGLDHLPWGYMGRRDDDLSPVLWAQRSERQQRQKGCFDRDAANPHIASYFINAAIFATIRQLP
jgi:hypothetical protein